MRINELLNEQEQLDEIPKWMGGTGGEMPGTAADTARGKLGTWIKKKTGMGAGGALLKQADQSAKFMYNQWLSIVPTLQQSGKINAGDKNSYMKYLTYYVQKRLGIKDPTALRAFKATIGPMPTKDTIIKAFSQAYQNAVIAKNAPTPSAAPAKSKKSKITSGTTLKAGGVEYVWNGTEWRRGDNGKPATTRIANALNQMSTGSTT